MDGKFSQKMLDFEKFVYLCGPHYTVPVVQLVRASDCGSECRGFESHQAPDESQSCDWLFSSGAEHPISKGALPPVTPAANAD